MVVATGFFDGVHLGHRFLIERLVQEAHSRGEQSVIVSFWPHPRAVLQDDARSLRLLSSREEKAAMLRGLGVDRVETLPFSKSFSRLTCGQYLRDYVKGELGATAVMVGYDSRLGSDNADASGICGEASRAGLEVIMQGPYSAENGMVVSSTRIRRALGEGRVEDAAAMLGYDYGLKGVVVCGNRLGRTIGFPTANMQLYEPLKMIPAGGVYHVGVNLDGRAFEGMCNIGVRPTVSAGQALSIETNIFDFDEDIYGLDIEIRFLRRIREERRFPSLSSLASQLALDRSLCRGR